MQIISGDKYGHAYGICTFEGCGKEFRQDNHKAKGASSLCPFHYNRSILEEQGIYLNAKG